MATILKCPRCQDQMDVTSVAPGSTVRCPGCNQQVRVPTGATSLSVKTVSAPIPPPQQVPAPRERGTRIRERSRSGTMPLPPQSAPKSNGGLFVGLGIGALGIVIVVIVFLMKGQNAEPPPPRKTADVAKSTPMPQPITSDKPIVLRSGDAPKTDPKLTTISKPAGNVDNANWDQLMRDLRPGGGFDHLDRPEGIAFEKVKSFGKAAYPKLISYIYQSDEQEPTISTAAVAVLNALTGRDAPLPKAATRAKAKAEWEEWLKTADAPKPDAPKEPEKK